MIRRPPRSTRKESSAASDVYKRQALGGALYNLRVTGPRVHDPSDKVFGTCSANYNIPYIVMNAAIGATKEDITLAVERFDKAYQQTMQK